MNLIKLLAIALAAVALFGCYYHYFSFNNQRQPVTVNVKDVNDYDFFYFVQSWPGSVHPTPTGVPVNFAIHGLWPQFNDGSYPKTCSPPPSFNINEIKALVKTLNKEWPSLSKMTNEEFWQYEWEKHGGCSASILPEKKYFNANLLLKEKTKILETLEYAGITPNDKKYSLRLIQKTLKDQVDFTPLIKCNTNGSDPTPEFYEVYFCVDRKGENFIDCPSAAVTAFKTGCGGDKPDIKFPIYKRQNHALNDIVESLVDIF